MRVKNLESQLRDTIKIGTSENTAIKELNDINQCINYLI